MRAPLLFISVIVLSVTATFSSAALSDQRLLLNFKGTASAFSKAVPDNTGLHLTSNGLLDSNCFTADVFDLNNGNKLGTAEDCLSEIAVGGNTDSGSGVQVVGTTTFNLKNGRLVVQGLTSVQPVNWPTENSDGITFTHITGANSPTNAVLDGPGDFSNTKRFKRASARVRLSGQVDLSQLEDAGQITFDCIFVVDID